jgi:hypothetical protein
MTTGQRHRAVAVLALAAAAVVCLAAPGVRAGKFCTATSNGNGALGSGTSSSGVVRCNNNQGAYWCQGYDQYANYVNGCRSANQRAMVGNSNLVTSHNTLTTAAPNTLGNCNGNCNNNNGNGCKRGSCNGLGFFGNCLGNWNCQGNNQISHTYYWRKSCHEGWEFGSSTSCSAFF